MLTLRLALRFLWREAKSGELSLIFFALFLAVTSATAIALFSSRLDAAMQDRSNQFLGADLRIESTTPIDAKWPQAAANLGMQTATTVNFPTVVLVGDDMVMASAKAVSANYPLKSKLLVENAKGEVQEQKSGPKMAEAWVEPRLLLQLNAKLGDELEIGRIHLKITGIIREESDRSASFYSFAPRVMFSEKHLPASGLLGTGSRITWRLLLKGEEHQLEQFNALIKTQPLEANQKLQSLESGNEMLAKRLHSAQRYLGLAAMLAVILAAVAVSISAKHYALRHFDSSALLRTFGLKQNQVWQVYLWQLIFLGVLASVAGLVFAYGIQEMLLVILDKVVPKPLPNAPLSAWLLGGSVGLISLLGFALVHLMPLAKVSPLRVLRRDLVPVPISGWLLPVFSLFSLALLLVLFTKDVLLSLYVLGGGAIFVLVSLLIFMGLIGKIKKYLANKNLPLTWRFAWQHLSKNSLYSSGQIIAFSLTIMVMVLIATLRQDLLKDWQQSLPDNSPNVFAINIQPYELEPVQAWLNGKKIALQKVFATVPGRLIAINNNSIANADFAKDSSIDRDLILTASAQLPEGNNLVAGHWHQATGGGQVSVEEKLAKRMNVKLGDTLTFRIAGQDVSAKVSSVRTVDWGSLTPNFFMIFSPDMLADLPTTYMTSFHYQNNAQLAELIKTFPTVTFIDIQALLTQIQALLMQVTLAIELILVFVLISALLVMLASLIAGVDERLKEGAILRTLGASRALLQKSQRQEFVILAVVSAVLALLGAEVIRYFLYTQVLAIAWQSLGWLWLIVPAASVVLLMLSGRWLLRASTNASPISVLRDL
ncbi:MAG: hypothetical protein RL217_365 [Pseudomonadota bacterium]|jgi:putative ABC transport system permease protein